MKEFPIQSEAVPGSTPEAAREKPEISVLQSIEETVSLYQEAKDDHKNREDLERFQSNCLQKAWVDMKGKQFVLPDDSYDEVKMDWMIELGVWFRNEIMEYSYPPEPGKQSRKDYFLQLFDTNPAKAVIELDHLFASSRH